MSGLQGVLLDADGTVAMISEDHPNHSKALLVRDKLKKSRANLYMSRYVVAEVATVLSQRIGHQIAVGFLLELNQSETIHVIDTNNGLERETQKVFSQQTSKNVSYVDCHNMVLVQQFKFDGIFSFDKHYVKNGVKLVT